MDYKKLGQNIRKFRLALGKTQRKLGEKVGVTDSHIGQIERADGIPSLDLVIKIANALGVTVDMLLADSYSHPEQIYLSEIAARIDKYPTKKKIVACEGLKAYLDTLESFGEN